MSPVTPADGGIPFAGSAQRRERVELRRAAEAFEALLVQQLVKQIRQSQLESGLFGESAGASAYDAMFDQHLGEQLARDSPFGIARLLEARWTENPDQPDNAERALRQARAILAEGAAGTQVPLSRADD